jgi:nucleoside-diphosphate-sugar epimerase
MVFEKTKVIKNALRVLKDKVGLYIYISTDSVYEVSEEAEHDGPSLEGDAVRPSDVDISQQLADNDSYGSEKLAGEELLAAARSSSGGPPYVLLR